MRKRKPPIVPITILLICVAVALGFNYETGINPKAQAEQAKEQPDEAKVGKPRPATDPKDVASQVKAQSAGAMNTGMATASSPTAKKRPMPPEMMKGPMANMASIETMPVNNSKPKPNDTSPSSQWYQSDSDRAHQ
jgi:hypothetical protein